ncbi:EamA family transporter [Bacillus sp. EB600]|nr:EamA family transporter [Bacillus sp. EB600]
MGGSLQQNVAAKTNLVFTNKQFKHYKGLSMVLLGAVLWGVSGTAAQVLFQRYGIHSGWLVTVRMSIAGLLILAGISMKSGLISIFTIWKVKRDALKLVLFGIIGLLGVQFSYFESIKYGNAATGTILQYMGPVFITIYAALRRKHLPHISQVISVFFALFGAFLLVTDGNWQRISISPLAVFWGILSAITLAFYTIYPGGLLQKYSAAMISGWGMLIGGIGMGFFHPIWRFSGNNSLSTWILVSFIVIFGTLIAFSVYIASLKYISASEASVLSCGEPLSATIIAVLFLHVQMGWASFAGGLCILITVTIMARNGSIEN